jgi:hypothetical protein
MKITEIQIDELFDDMLTEPEMNDWAASLSTQEYEDARRIFRMTVRKAIDIDKGAN